MNVQKIIQTPIAQKMKKLKFEYSIDVITGNYKNAKKTYREFAKLAVDNYETAKVIGPAIQGNIPLFSKYGINALKYIIYNFFTKKTSEEKLLKKLSKENSIRHLKS